jgi:hypothetical protein
MRVDKLAMCDGFSELAKIPMVGGDVVCVSLGSR